MLMKIQTSCNGNATKIHRVHGVIPNRVERKQVWCLILRSVGNRNHYRVDEDEHCIEKRQDPRRQQQPHRPGFTSPGSWKCRVGKLCVVVETKPSLNKGEGEKGKEYSDDEDE